MVICVFLLENQFLWFKTKITFPVPLVIPGQLETVEEWNPTTNEDVMIKSVIGIKISKTCTCYVIFSLFFVEY